ncbi:hypothetical protein BMEGG_05871 [Priestia megaterium]
MYTIQDILRYLVLIKNINPEKMFYFVLILIILLNILNSALVTRHIEVENSEKTILFLCPLYIKTM